MQINRPVLKKYAKKSIAETTPSPVAVALAFILITYILQLLQSNLVGYNKVMNEMMMQYYSGNFGYLPGLPHIPWYAGLTSFAISLMSFMLSVGYTIFSLNVVNKKNANFGNLFDGFGIFFKVVWLQILMWIFVFLWSLLLIVPGIIAAYRYRQALYIMLENPEMSALECITASKMMMNGHKSELFVMDLSFLGWYILCAIPFVTIWVTPYTSISYATYYIALRDMPQNEMTA